MADGNDSQKWLDFLVRLALRRQGEGDKKCWANREEIKLLARQSDARVIKNRMESNETYVAEVEYKKLIFIYASFEPIELS